MTTPVRIKKILKDHLDDLTEDAFHTFQWHLVDYESPGCGPTLRSQLEGATRERTVDKLVQVYGEDGAVDTTVDIFFEMKYNDLASKLIQAMEQPITPPVRNTKRKYYSTSTDNISHRPHKKVKQEDFENIKQFCESSSEQIKNQSHDTEEKIKKDFQELRHFLDREEKARLAALKKEETEKIFMMEMIAETSKVTFSLSDTVKEMAELYTDNFSLQSYKTKIERFKNALPGQQQLPKVDIDVPKHVKNLQFQIWRKMEGVIKNAAIVNMDRNSASPQPSVSDDVTTATVTDTRQKSPENLPPIHSQGCRDDVEEED